MPKAKKESKGAAPKAANGHGLRHAPSIGDNVKVFCHGSEYEGLLLPESRASAGFLHLKLNSGYNVGIRKEGIARIEVISKGAPISAKRDDAKTLPTMAKSGKDKRHTTILACGGTIASRIDYQSGAVYPATTPEELLAGFPFASRYNARPRMLFSLLSEDMVPAHWVKIAEAAAEEIRGGAEGVVITHGTDTMHYTSAALSFMLQNLPCPVILTGSQRSSDRGSSDAGMNMHASLIASRANLSGVFICMHGGLSDDMCLLHFGTRARKMHTTRRDAFRSIGCLPAAKAFPARESVEILSSRAAPRDMAKKPLVDTKINTNVAIIQSYPGIKPEAFSSLSKYDGVVAIGTGMGHLPTNLRNDPLSKTVLPAVKGLIDSGIPVVLASQAIYGRVGMDVYASGRALREIGAIGHMCDMTPETAYAKLCFVLGHEKKMGRVRALMEADIAGEITDRSEISDY